MLTHLIKSLLALSAVLLLSAPVQAEQKQVMGDIDVHYIALNSTLIPAKVATNYGITRSKINALINISVLDNTTPNKPAKSVGISGVAKNLLGHKKDLEFIEVVEGDAIYYLAQLRFTNEEQFTFTITLLDQGKEHTLTFKQKLYAD
ncbi:DUF4426 domain-containing protein [Thalassotalea eurytherma]|uniref:DUF4426 domain-containing protein n=1 Tax=Thalassotalea eurytherma TaxID=1144278 RepID=A0ABQ6H514_9GAMM|nr:DUF4426 domain-containing protein [Thalassotalea eurytherma]GLX81516.1 hypothetical protein theurythT_09680 [Thalassotalea eurytherma]